METTPAPLTVGVGSADNCIIFDADPLDGTIAISADYGAEIEFTVEEFAAIAAMLCHAADAA